jgi:hypothetical protein
MRFAFWIAVLMFVLIIGLSLKVSSVQASINPTPTPTIGNPVFGFSIGYASSSRAEYAPKNGEVCKVWDDISNGYLGAFRPQTYIKKYLFIKFTSNAIVALSSNNVECEEPSNYSSEDRMNWYTTHQTYKATYTTDNSKAVYVDGSNLAVVTLTATPSNTDTPSLTCTATATYANTVTNTATSTLTPTITPTSTYTNTATSTRTATATSTATATPVLIADKIVPINVSALHIPKAGDICYGQVVGNLGNKVVEFVADFQTGIEVRGGGCFTSKYYNLGQVLRYLESKGIRLGYESLPKPSLTPTRTLIPTATIVRFLAIGLSTTGTKSVLIEANTICWGAKVGNIEYKVVKFQRSLSTPLNITKGGCTYGQNLNAEDVFNYLRRVFNTPLRGFVDVQ